MDVVDECTCGLCVALRGLLRSAMPAPSTVIAGDYSLRAGCVRVRAELSAEHRQGLPPRIEAQNAVALAWPDEPT